MIPETFELGARQWKVLWKSDKDLRKLHPEKEKSWGRCEPDSCEIWLNSEVLEYDYWFSVHCFEHELEHAIRFTYGLHEHCEVEVDGLSMLRTQFLKTKRSPDEPG